MEIHWLHNNLTIPSSEGIQVTKAGKKLVTLAIDSVEEKHSGVYTCLVKNRAGSDQFSAHLNVNGNDSFWSV